MNTFGANYPIRGFTSSALGTTTVIARKTYTGNLVSNTGAKSDVFSPSKATVLSSTYTIPRQSAGLSQATKLQTSTFNRTTLQDCLTCR